MLPCQSPLLMPCELQNCKLATGRAEALGGRSRYSSVPRGELSDTDEGTRSVTLTLRSPAAHVSLDHAPSQTLTNKCQGVLGTRVSWPKSFSFPLFHPFHFAGPSDWAVAQQRFPTCFEDQTHCVLSLCAQSVHSRDIHGLSPVVSQTAEAARGTVHIATLFGLVLNSLIFALPCPSFPGDCKC